MLQTFTVHTGKGSLKQPVKIVFTITPVRSKRSTSSFKPIKFGTLTLGMNAERDSPWSIQWNTELGFRTYQVDLGAGGEGVWGHGDFHGVLPGQVCAITEFDFNPDGVHWSEPGPYNDHVAYSQSSVMATNKTSSSRNVFLACCVNGEWHTMAAYHNIPAEGYVIAPSELQLQAYVVDIDSPEDEDDLHVCLNALTDFSRPLFSTPLNCDALPMKSTWRLSQDQNGVLQLNNDSNPESAFYSIQDTIEKLGKFVLHGVSHSLKELQSQMGAVQNALEATNARLDSRTLEVESKTERLAATLERIEARVAAAEKSVGRAEVADAVGERPSTNLATKITVLEKRGEDTRKEMSVVQKILDNTLSQLDGVKVKVLAVGGTGDELARSFGQTQREVFEIRESVARTRSQTRDLTQMLDTKISEVQRAVDIIRNQLGDKGPNIGAAELEGQFQKRLSTIRDEMEAASRGFGGRVSVLDRSVAQMGTRLEALGRTQTESNTKLYESISSVKTQMDKSRHEMMASVQVVDVKVGKVEASFMKLQPSSINDTLTSAQTPIVALEQKIARAELQLSTVQKSVDIIREQLDGEPSSVPVVEAEHGKLPGRFRGESSVIHIGPATTSGGFKNQIAALGTSVAHMNTRLDVLGTTQAQNHTSLSESLSLMGTRFEDTKQKLALVEKLAHAVDDKAVKVETSLSRLQQAIPRTIVTTFHSSREIQSKIETIICHSEVMREFVNTIVLPPHVDLQLSEAKTKVEDLKTKMGVVHETLASVVEPRLSTIEAKVVEISKSCVRGQDNIDPLREKAFTTSAESLQERVARLEGYTLACGQGADAKEAAEDKHQGLVDIRAQLSAIEKTNGIITANVCNIQSFLLATQTRVQPLDQQALDFRQSLFTRAPEGPYQQHASYASFTGNSPPLMSRAEDSSPEAPSPQPLSPALTSGSLDSLQALGELSSPEPPSPVELPPCASD